MHVPNKTIAVEGQSKKGDLQDKPGDILLFLSLSAYPMSQSLTLLIPLCRRPPLLSKRLFKIHFMKMNMGTVVYFESNAHTLYTGAKNTHYCTKYATGRKCTVYSC